ncbi:hypothetical protein FGF1_14260 [Flavobacteriaceae bacterium GF1]
MKGVLSRIILKEEFLFDGTVEQLGEKLRFQNNKKFRVEWIDHQSFKFLSNFSLGTLMINNNPGVVEGIKGYARLSETAYGKIKISLTTKVRIELYFFLAAMVIAIIAVLGSKDNFPIWMIWLTPLGLLWFWFVYRMQEQILFNKLKNYLTK